MTEQRPQVGCVSVLGSGKNENDYETQKNERTPLRESSARLDTSIIQPTKYDRDDNSEQQMREIYGEAFQAIQLEGIQRRPQVASNSSRSQGLEWACKPVTEKYHPAGHKTYKWREEARGVSYLAGRVGNSLH